jgi:hypothetical protein
MGVNYRDSEASGYVREPRFKVFQPIPLGTAAGTVRAHLLNLSRTGALIHCADAPDRGSIVRVMLGETANPARVIWRDGKRFGVAFAGKLAPAQIDDALATQNDLVTRAVAKAA